MRVREFALIGSLAALAGCGGPSRETLVFELRYLDDEAALAIVRPYLEEDRPGGPGTFSIRGQTITVSHTREDIARIARELAEADRPPAPVRLVFTIIQADGAGPVDSNIAPIEAQLRRLFRFRGYRAIAQAVTVASEHSAFNQAMPDGRGGRYQIGGELETVEVRGDSGVVRLRVEMVAPQRGSAFSTRLSVGIGQTAVLGGQSDGGRGALILAVRAEVVEQ